MRDPVQPIREEDPWGDSAAIVRSRTEPAFPAFGAPTKPAQKERLNNEFLRELAMFKRVGNILGNNVYLTMNQSKNFFNEPAFYKKIWKFL